MAFKLSEVVAKYGNFTVRIPMIGTGCGVLGLSFAKLNVNMGKYASQLLRSLEYRGYDSTGAAIQDDKGNITLKKDVGAPSDLVKTLGITQMKGKIFCGQVRWATFGAVTKDNAQPHEVKCKKHIYGAHNGNITNTSSLKEFLSNQGHKVVSDNDGEMLVHMVEHYFDMHLEKHQDSKHNDTETRKDCMRKAILSASEKVIGSYAAVIVDPVTEVSYAIKAGSSLYAGKGSVDENNYILISSDLTAILKFTKNIIDLKEGTFIEYDSDNYQVYAFKDVKWKYKDGSVKSIKKGEKIAVPVTRSKLRAEDTELVPPFKFFMHQEIFSQAESSRKLIAFFDKGSASTKSIRNVIESLDFINFIKDYAKKIYRSDNITEQKDLFDKFKSSKEFKKISEKLKNDLPDFFDSLNKKKFIDTEFFSTYSSIYLDIISEKEYIKDNILAAKILDIGAEIREIDKFHMHADAFAETIFEAWKNHRSIYTISCGTSYNATKTAALFFNEIAGIKFSPILPGNFRGQYSNSIREDDVFVGVSQSGETKDLIDIFNDIESSGIKVKKITIVNNENSTLAQEKCDFYLPIKCGPEIAVPATKSYMNQVLLFYYLAIKVAEFKINFFCKEKKKCSEELKDLERRYETLKYIPELIQETLRTTETQVDKMADSLFMQPSIHILATKISSVAEEGALKIRETVLNHTQGIEGSEFKHGPNTILGFNTIFGTEDLEYFIKYNKDLIAYAVQRAQSEKISDKETAKLISDLSSYIFEPVKPFNISQKAQKIFNEAINKFDFIDNLDTNYPLIFLTGPDPRDVNLTISQINTHKIRGANTYLIAEDNDDLVKNCRSVPTDNGNYEFINVKLPKTDDTLLSTFSSIVVLQLLALKMSIKKMKYLNKLHIPLHGVHPDVPKNVSKSITVD